MTVTRSSRGMTKGRREAAAVEEGRGSEEERAAARGEEGGVDSAGVGGGACRRTSADPGRLEEDCVEASDTRADAAPGTMGGWMQGQAGRQLRYIRIAVLSTQ